MRNIKEALFGIIILSLSLLLVLSIINNITLTKDVHAKGCLITFLASGNNHSYNITSIYNYDVCMNITATNPNQPTQLLKGEVTGKNLQLFNILKNNATQINQTFLASPVPRTAYIINGALADGEWYQVSLDYNWSSQGWAFGYEYWNKNTTSNYTDSWEKPMPIKNGDKVNLSMGIKNNELTIKWMDLNNKSTSITYIEPIGYNSFIPSKISAGNSIVFTGAMTETQMRWLG